MTNALFIMAHPECTAGMRREGKAIWRGRETARKTGRASPYCFFFSTTWNPSEPMRKS